MRPPELAVEDRTIERLLRDRAEGGADRTYLLWDEKRWTYGEVEMVTNALAAGFRGRGIGPGSHLAIFMKNSPEYLWICLALGKIGAVGVPINTAAKGQLLTYLLTDSDSEYAVVDQAHADTVAAAAPDLHLIIGDEATASSLPTIAELIADGEARRERPIAGGASFNDPWVIIYTSGTTGPSKGVLCSHAHPIGVAQEVSRVFEYDSEDRHYTCLPLFHANALWYSALTALSSHASIAMVERFSASRFWSDIRRYEATIFNAIMTIATILEKMDVSPEEIDNTIRLAFVVPLPARRRELEERWGLQFVCNYAMTELTPAVALRPGEGQEKGNTSGTAVDYIDLRIVDDNDMPVPAGTPGEVAVRPRDSWSIFSSYYGKPEATAEAFRNVWFHTGDRAYLDEDGFFYFVDRKTDSIRRRGENISAHEIELVMETCPGIQEAAAIPISSEMGEDDVAIYVVRRNEDLTEVEVIEYARDNLAYYMVPRFVAFLDELPKTPTHKKEKYKLRELATAEGAGALWDREEHGIVVARDSSAPGTDASTEPRTGSASGQETE